MNGLRVLKRQLARNNEKDNMEHLMSTIQLFVIESDEFAELKDTFYLKF
jgi:hypothetical protein